MAAFFLFPRVLFVELLDFYRFQNTRFYLYILSLFAIRLFIGQAVARRGRRQNLASSAGKARVYRNAREVCGAHLQSPLRAGITIRHNREVIPSVSKRIFRRD